MMIDLLRGQYVFLSNIHLVDVEMDGVIYPSVEHAYQAAKTDNPEDRERIRTAKTPVSARMMGKKVVLRSGWDYHKVKVMEGLIRAKFSDPELRMKLVETNDEELVEGNAYHDQYWGKCTCDNHKGAGLNWLGRLLMKVREEAKQDTTVTPQA